MQCEKHYKMIEKLTAEDYIYETNDFLLVEKIRNKCKDCKKQIKYQEKRDKEIRKRLENERLKNLCS